MRPEVTAPKKQSFLLQILGIIGLLFGLAIFIPGIELLFVGGSWFFAIAGAGTMFAGWKIFRGDAIGTWVYLGVCAFALLWSLFDVRHLESWFWPLIPRLFAFAVALFFVLLLSPLMPRFRGDARSRMGFLAGAAVVLVGLVVTVSMMFQPHGVVRHDFRVASGTAITPAATAMGGEWRNYGRTLTGTRFSPESQINKGNVDRLKVAWTYRTGFYADETNADENTPTYANNTLFSCTPYNTIHAIDPVTGRRKWVFNSDSYAPFAARCRGVTYYEVADATGACSKRLAMTTVSARLFSIDAETGQPCQDFGEAGIVNMGEGMKYFQPSVYMSNSAPTVSHGKVISGAMQVDNYKVGEPSGVVRAWDARTGKLAWAWDIGRPGKTGPLQPGEYYTPFTPNVWTHMAVDEERGIVYLATGNATPDAWLGHRRPFDHEYTATIVALDVNTGLEKWHFRTTNKDIWDYDLPAQPSLYDLPDPKTGGTIPVLIQLTKRGQIFMLNRVTGQPVAAVENRKVFTGDREPSIVGMATEQPYSVGMPTIGAGRLTEADMWGLTPIDLAACRKNFKSLRYSGDEFTALGTKPSIGYPSALGGMNWGSGTIDERRGLLFVNDIRFPMVVRLVPRKDVPNKQWPKDGHAVMAPQLGTPFGLQRNPVTSPFGFLCLRPPYGTLSAIDLNTRKIVWQRPIGTIESLDFIGAQTGMKIPIGMPTLGGSLSTGAGLLFFAGAMDHYMRIIDSETGEILREVPIPVGATATPMTYVGPDGKQYIVLSVGGSSSAVSKYRGDYVVAFTLG